MKAQLSLKNKNIILEFPEISRILWILKIPGIQEIPAILWTPKLQGVSGIKKYPQNSWNSWNSGNSCNLWNSWNNRNFLLNTMVLLILINCSNRFYFCFDPCPFLRPLWIPQGCHRSPLGAFGIWVFMICLGFIPLCGVLILSVN